MNTSDSTLIESLAQIDDAGINSNIDVYVTYSYLYNRLKT